MFSYNRDELTVMTPKVESRAASFIGRRSFGSRAAFSSTFHLSNPNPQVGDNIFKGPRDMGYKKYYESQTDRDMNTVIKFGKKVDYQNKMTNDELMEDHLKQIRDKLS